MLIITETEFYGVFASRLDAFGMQHQSSSESKEKPASSILISKIANGDESAFRKLVTRYIGVMLRFANNLTGQAGVAEDMVQQTLIKAECKAHCCKPRAEISTWLYAVLRNECLQ